MRIAILGTGLIGGSLGLALKRLPKIDEVVGFDRDPGTAAMARTRGAVDRVASTPAGAVRNAQVCFVATPVRAIVPAIEACLPGLSPGTVVTDVGSTKSRVVLEAEALMAGKDTGCVFIGGHPMAGSEQEGIEAAREDLFKGAWWVLTPGESAGPRAFKTLQGILSGLGARVMALEPQRHDELMAVISHIPQLTASTLMNLALEKSREHAGVLALAAGGFRDVTRVAASNPDLWVEICLENRQAISATLEEMASLLHDLNQQLRVGDTEGLRKVLLTARDARRTLGKKDVPGDLFEIRLEIPDQPGVLAHVTRLVGELGINIEDIGITHASEGGRGSLQLSVLGEAESLKVHNYLLLNGYRVTSIKL